MIRVRYTYNPNGYPLIENGVFADDIILQNEVALLVIPRQTGRNSFGYDHYGLRHLYFLADYGMFDIPCYVRMDDSPLPDPERLCELLIGYARYRPGNTVVAKRNRHENR